MEAGVFRPNRKCSD